MDPAIALAMSEDSFIARSAIWRVRALNQRTLIHLRTILGASNMDILKVEKRLGAELTPHLPCGFDDRLMIG